MLKFSELKITIEPENEVFTGKKKEMDEIIGVEIIIHDYKVLPSKFPEKAYPWCLHLQIEVEGKKWVSFSGSKNLILFIQKVDRECLPIRTTIMKQEKKLMFT